MVSRNRICQYLAVHGWLYSEGGCDGLYDRAQALFPADVLAWVQETQPKAWEALVKKEPWWAGRRNAA
jgi:type I restriction enzyme R subunit